MTIQAPVGIAGLGRMGAAIARRLLALGHPVIVWNRDPGKVAPLIEAGAEAAESAAALATRCPVVISMLFDDNAVEQVYGGPDGLLAAEVSGRLFIDMSTVSPAAATKVGRAVAEAGANFVECPVGGSVGPAAEGKLLGLAGADEVALDRARPVLELLCRKIVHAGPVGAGARLKLAVNLPLLVYWQALGEAMSLAADTGLSGAELIELMADTSATPLAMKLRAADIAAAIAGDTEMPVAFELRGALKDLTTMVDAAKTEGAVLPVAAAARTAYAEAVAAGAGPADATFVAFRSWRARRPDTP